MSLPLSNKLTIFSVIFVAETAATMVYMTGQGLIKGRDGYIPFQSAPLPIRGSSLRINEGFIQKHSYSPTNVMLPSEHDSAVCRRDRRLWPRYVHRCPRTWSSTLLTSCKFDLVGYNKRVESIRTRAGRKQRWPAAAPIRLHVLFIAEMPVPVGSTWSEVDEYHAFGSSFPTDSHLGFTDRTVLSIHRHNCQEQNAPSSSLAHCKQDMPASPTQIWVANCSVPTDA